MVDAVLAETGKVQARVRELPSRVMVYLLLAAGLFAELGYGQVWAKMISGLDGLTVATPTASALAQARRRIGVAPLRALLDLLRGPAAGSATKGMYQARPVGHRDRRHHDVLPGHVGELAGVPPGWGPPRRHRISDDPAAGAGRVRHPTRTMTNINNDTRRSQYDRHEISRLTERECVAELTQHPSMDYY